MLAAHPNVEDWHKYYGYEPVEDNITSTYFTDRPSGCLTSTTTCLGLDPKQLVHMIELPASRIQ
jgi:hypothetical protein